MTYTKTPVTDKKTVVKKMKRVYGNGIAPVEGSPKEEATESTEEAAQEGDASVKKKKRG